MNFVKGQEYRRRLLHETLGGQEQGGISTPSQRNIVMLFTSSRGAEYGYRDGWTAEGTFLYTGEGQSGDMQFIRGNAAVRDHFVEGKELHLFENVGGDTVRYLGQMVYIGHRFQKGSDAKGQIRQIIVFELKPVD